MSPGVADLTVDVDFGFLKHFLQQDDKAFALGPVSQGAFLEAMQGAARLEVRATRMIPLNVTHYCVARFFRTF